MVTSATTVSPADSHAGLTFRPNVDICDRGSDVVIVADVPGATAAGIEVTIDDGVLSLHAPVAAREAAGRSLRREYGVGAYRRSFRLGDGFDPSGVEADYRRGVLTVRVPRSAATQPRRVVVRTA